MAEDREQLRIYGLLMEESDESEIDDSSDGEENYIQEEPVVEPVHNSESEQSDDDSDLTNNDSNCEYFIGKDKVTRWRKFPINRNVRTRNQNIITHLPGPKRCAKNSKSELDCFSLLIDDNLLQNITDCTNIYITKVQPKYVNQRYCRLTDKTEIQATIGLLLFAGSFRGGKQNLKDLWKYVEMFSTTMALNRFLFILRCLRFDDINDRDQRKSQDKLAPVRYMFTKFIENCIAVYSVSEYCTIDEQLAAFRGKCTFKQYIPSKPARYGIKIQTLCDARTWYTLNMEIYPGKQPDGPFSLSNSAKDVVLRLIEPISGSGRNITTDNWYSSLGLSEELLKKKLSFVGTLRKNKPQIPKELLNVKERPEKSSMFAYRENLTLVSYVPKKRKNVLLLSSMHPESCTIDESTEEEFKPEMITFYNVTKAGVDTVDKLCSTYTCARKCNRWPLIVFFRILDIAGINSFVLFKANNDGNDGTNRLQYLRTLSTALLDPQIRKRAVMQNLPKEIRTKACKIAKLEPVQPDAANARTAGRCTVCPRKSDKKTKFYCNACQKYMCLNHMKNICHDCFEKKTIESSSSGED